jgi:2-oxoglutarate ferredoxin oxidoreductase subunit delta
MDGLVQLDLELCKACGVCIELCPDEVFGRDKLGFPVLEREEACRQCLLCELHCPDFAIEVRRRERKAVAKGKPAAAGVPAHADVTDATPALTRDDLVSASRGVHENGCTHNGEEG